MKWIKLPAHKNPIILEQFGVELKLSFRHKESIVSKSVIKSPLFRIQNRFKDLEGLQSGEKSFYSLDSPFLQEHFNQKGVLVHYGNFESLELAKAFAEKEASVILSELMGIMDEAAARRVTKRKR